MKKETKNRFKAATLAGIILAATIYGTSCNAKTENNNTNATTKVEYSIPQEYIIDVPNDDIFNRPEEELREEYNRLEDFLYNELDPSIFRNEREYQELVLINSKCSGDIKRLELGEDAKSLKVQLEIAEIKRKQDANRKQMEKQGAIVDYLKEKRQEIKQRLEDINNEYKRQVEERKAEKSQNPQK
ncbi:MAG: hypothetical protein IJT25_00040 [Clostridia bacterium]|nr:hypothetical protein [Clostridia bacterium]